MSRYRGPRLRIIRRLGKAVVLPGLTTKTSIKEQPPGKPRSSDNKGKATEYGIRLTEKQKLKYNYGLTEKQLAFLISTLHTGANPSESKNRYCKKPLLLAYINPNFKGSIYLADL